VPEEGEDDILATLLYERPEVDPVDDQGNTPLHIASQ